MTEPLIVDGLTYISIRDAAAASRLSTEYLVAKGVYTWLASYAN